MVQAVSEPVHAKTPVPRIAPQVQGRIDTYVAQVECRLERTNLSPDRCRGLVIKLRETIIARVAALDAPSPSADDIDAILQDLGPPQSYVENLPAVRELAGAPSPSRRLSWLAVAAVIWIVPFVALMIASIVLAHVPLNRVPPAVDWIVQFVLFPLGLAAPLVTTALGLIAIGRIQRRLDQQYGLSLALFDSLFFPLLLIDFGIFWLCWQGALLLADRNLIGPAAGAGITQVLPTVACILADYWIAAKSWRSVRNSARREEC